MAKQISKKQINRVQAPLGEGLNQEQVNERVLAGWTNVAGKTAGKSYLEIICSNVFTLFNFLCLLMAGVIIAVGRPGDALFSVIYLANTLIGIIQEIRAKNQVEKLSLMTAPSATVTRGGEDITIPVTDVVVDDIVLYRAGDQITIDGIVLCEGLEVNESLLTGESVSVRKKVGDVIYAGSFVSSGRGYCRADKVGEDKYVEGLTRKARQYKAPKSQLFVSLKKLINIITMILIPLGVVLSISNYNLIIGTREGDIADLVTRTAGALVGLIPAGMFLLTSTALAVGVINLSRRKTLVRDLYSIEMLARVDVLCLDKTGTITDGTMRVDEVIGDIDEVEIKCLCRSLIDATKDDNPTARAILKYASDAECRSCVKYVAFSSEKKMSAVSLSDGYTYILGAEEFVIGTSHLSTSYAEKGKRVVVLAKAEGGIGDSGEIPLDRRLVATIVIEDTIRDTAIETIEWFRQNNVEVKIISGDNPLTVSRIAEQVGVENASRYISLDGMSEDEVRDAVDKYTVFGRVSPEQKYFIINQLKKQGRTVGMTGDGVNDILAFKEADCSVAMAEGSDAAKAVATVVLTNSDFASMPKVVEEGRRVVNNIEKSSSLFLMKNIFTMLFTIVMICAGSAYPLTPSKVMLYEVFVIGLPSFVLALQPNKKLIKGNFLFNVLSRAIPYGLLFFLSVLSVYLIAPAVGLEAHWEQMVVYTLTYVGFVSLFNLSRPFNKLRTAMVITCFVLSVVGFVVLPSISFAGKPMLDMSPIPLEGYGIVGAIVLVAIPLMYLFNYLTDKVVERITKVKI